MYTTYVWRRSRIFPFTLSRMTDPGSPPDPQTPPPSYQPYGQAEQLPAYGQPTYGQPAYGPPVYDYAHWIKRVGSYLLDGLFTMLTAIPAYALLFAGISLGTQDMQTVTDANGVSTTTGEWNSGGTALTVIGALLFLVPLAFFVWNSCVRQGRTGRSLGRGIIGTQLLGEASAQPVGAGIAFVRQLCHVVDGFCYLGYLWPLWDRKRQTFADKIMSTVVVNERS